MDEPSNYEKRPCARILFYYILYDMAFFGLGKSFGVFSDSGDLTTRDGGGKPNVSGG